MRILIIEDEQVASDQLKTMLQEIDPHFQIQGPLDSIEDSVDWFIKNKMPDLVLMDIHLADGLSFQIFEKTPITSPVIFTTAYDQYAIRAFKTKSVDYLLKPIKLSELRRAIEKYKEVFASPGFHELSERMKNLSDLIQQQHENYKDRFLVRSGKQITSIPAEEIAYIVYEDRTTIITTVDNHRYPINYKLDELEEVLDPKVFTRANRQFIIHFQSIKKINPWFKGRLKLELFPEQKVDLVISSEKTGAFKKWLGQ